MRGLAEGDYVYVRGVGYLAVKGVSHPPGRIVAVPVYREERRGSERIKDLGEAYRHLEARMPGALLFDDHAGQVIPQIPEGRVHRSIRAVDGLRAVQRSDALSSAAVDLALEVSERAGLARDEVGLSGSILLGTAGGGPDIDLVFYPSSDAMRVVEALGELRRAGGTAPVNASFLHDISSKRGDSRMGIEAWLRHEARKLLYGLYRGFLYSAKIVPMGEVFWEPYGSRRWRELGRATVRAVVIDDSRSIFTPNQYGVEVSEVIEGIREAARVSEIASYRSRFAEQARAGEEVIASGRLEVDLRSWRLRILVGNDRDDLLGLPSLLQ